MPDETPLIRSLRAAVAAAPDDVPLRLHLAGLLLDAGLGDEAVAETAVALQYAPGDAEARALMARAMGVPAASPSPDRGAAPAGRPDPGRAAGAPGIPGQGGPAPDAAARDSGAPGAPSPDAPSPGVPAAGASSADGPSRRGGAAGDAAADGTAADGTAAGGTDPGGTDPGGTAADGTAADGTDPGGAAADGSAVDGSTRDGAAPGRPGNETAPGRPGGTASGVPAPRPAPADAAPGDPGSRPADPHAPEGADAAGGTEPAGGTGGQDGPAGRGGTSGSGFDWSAAERELRDAVPPRFVSGDDADGTPRDGSATGRTGTEDRRPDGAAPPGDTAADGWSAADSRDPADSRGEFGRPPGEGRTEPLRAGGFGDTPGDAAGAWDVETGSTVRLADVGGMREVKERLEAAFLAPMRNPELRKLFGKSLRGGLLLYGPPGCGKTFLARAVAGELGARFLTVSLNDVLDMWIGRSERNLHDVFETARRAQPCVLFLDELDALGAKRSRMAHSGLRNTVNQLLTELDGVNGGNDGVFVLAATNHPWDVDTALRRPGRLDRTLLVLPPDEPAREAILRYHLRDRPVAGVDLAKLVRRTEDFSGADLAHLCESASERALMDSVRTGEVRMIGMRDLLEAAKQIRPSTDAWFASARNVAMFANEGGQYDDLLAHLKRKRKL